MSCEQCPHEHPNRIGRVLIFRPDLPGAYGVDLDPTACHAAISEPRVSFRQCSRRPVDYTLLCKQHHRKVKED